MRSLAFLLAAVLGVSAIAAGCGSSSNNSSASKTSSTQTGASSSTSGGGAYGGGSSTKKSTVATVPKSNIALRADPSGGLKFTTSHVVAKAGKVNIKMMNPSSTGLPHGIAVEGHGVDSDGKVVPSGQTSSLTVSLKKGTYEFYCPVPSHKKAGMTGTITVQ